MRNVCFPVELHPVCTAQICEARRAFAAPGSARVDPPKSETMPAAVYAALLAFGVILLVIALMGLIAFR